MIPMILVNRRNPAPTSSSCVQEVTLLRYSFFVDLFLSMLQKSGLDLFSLWCRQRSGTNCSETRLLMAMRREQSMNSLVNLYPGQREQVFMHN